MQVPSNPFIPMQVLKPLLTPRDVARALSVSVRTVWRLVEQKKFPEPVRLSRKCVRWPASDLVSWLEGFRGLILPSDTKEAS